ncbi:hypothetical protein CDD81_1321 [Ophiocordyceps australis]|uniref:VPS4-associated protein 1 n=1 Tax=Ophiocordyceps australis TaxID=1399860 RepID=A0A2C5XZ87_9HYPO|nr:hypothetical protein CDD81_1321 [Ophiocordyceps australis]
MAPPFPNIYTHRKVADAAAKSCDICYKPSTSVLITPDQKDFFYVCTIHLKDTHFCTPKIDHEAIKAKRERELAAEVELVKKEYEERLRRNKEKEANLEKNRGKEHDKEPDKDEDKDKKEEKEKNKMTADEKEPGQEIKTEATAPDEEESRVFELKSAFYQQRLGRKRQLEAAKKDRERASQSNYFPSVPNNLPGK